jgi:redox-sensitive bicupin YhaK (pirin superfamily)
MLKNTKKRNLFLCKKLVVTKGPFSMNTEEEIEQAYKDFRERKNGFESANWRSEHARKIRA